MSVADAYVELHVDGDALAGEIRTSVRAAGVGAEKDTDTVGRSLGSRLGTTMAGSLLTGFKTKLGGAAGNIGKYMKTTFGGFNPRSLMIPAIVALIPLATSTISALAGTLTALTGAVVQAGSASIALVGIFGALIQAAIVGKIAFSGFGKAIGGDAEAMKELSPAAQLAAKAVKGLKDEWAAVKNEIQQKTFEGLAEPISRLGTTLLPVLQQQLGGTGYVLNKIFKDMLGFVTSRGFVEKFGKAIWNNNRILERLGQAVVPGLGGLLDIFLALQPAAKRLSGVIVKIVKDFGDMAGKASTAQKIDDFLKRAFVSAGRLWRIFKGLGTAIINVFSAATPAGGDLLKTLARLSEQFAAFTGKASSQNAIADWAERGISATKTMFRVLGDLGALLGPLFNPDIAGGFFSVFEKIIPVIGSVTSAIGSALMPILENIGAAFAENGPKIMGLFEALSPLLAGVGAVIGQIFTQALGLIGTIADIITPVVGAISNVLGPILTKFAPIIAFLILAFTNWGSVIVKLVPYIGKFAAPIVKLAEYLYSKVIPVLSFLGKVFAVVFKGIAATVKFVAPFVAKFVTTYFGIIGKVIGFVMKFVGGIVKLWWGVVSKVFKAAMTIIGAVVRTGFNIYKNIVQTVFRIVVNVVKIGWKILSTIFRVGAKLIQTVLVGPLRFVFNLFRTIFNSVVNVVRGVFNTIRVVVTSGISAVVNFIKGLPQKILSLASNFLDAGKELGSKIITGLWNGLKAVGGAVADFGQSIKDSINSALNLPVSIHGPGPLPDFTIPAFAQGGRSRGGLALVGERGPELVDLPRDSRVYTNQQSRNMAGRERDSFPRKVILRIGSRDFEAYASEVADGRIAAADSLAWQGG